jgi:hypothetical protein
VHYLSKSLLICACHTQLLTLSPSILWAYIVFNVFGALFLYWLVRVPKNKLRKKKQE